MAIANFSDTSFICLRLASEISPAANSCADVLRFTRSLESILPPPGRDLRTVTPMTAHLPGSVVITFAVIGFTPERKSRSLNEAHRPLRPATHEPALQTLVYRWQYCTDPDPLEHHRIPI